MSLVWIPSLAAFIAGIWIGYRAGKASREPEQVPCIHCDPYQ